MASNTPLKLSEISPFNFGISTLGLNKNFTKAVQDAKNEGGLQATLRELFKDIVTNAHKRNPFKNTAIYAEALSIGDVTASQHSDAKAEAVNEALEKIKDSADEIMMLAGNKFLEENDEKFSITMKRRIEKIFNAVIRAFECVLEVLGIADRVEPANNAFESSVRFQKIMSILFMLSTLITTIAAVSGPIGVVAVVGLVLTIWALSLLYPYFKPRPNFLPKALNWSAEIRDGHMPQVSGRSEQVQMIAEVFTNRGKDDTMHPLIIGQSGVGKTETVKAFAQAVERGDYAELKGKTIFYINTPDIVKDKDDNYFKKLCAAIARHGNDLILIFDEIHLVCHEDYIAIGEKLKPLLDAKGKPNFPNVIGITTAKEYKKYIAQNDAFARRFKNIPISGMDNSQTMEVISASVMKQMQSTIIEDGALSYLIEQSSTIKGLQPTLASRMLAKVEALTKNSDDITTGSQKVLALLKKIQRALTSQAAASSFTSLGKKDFSQTFAEECNKCQNQGVKTALGKLQFSSMKDLNATIREYEKTTVVEEREQIKQLIKIRTAYARAKKEFCKTAKEIANLSQERIHTVRSLQLMKRFVLMRDYLLPAFESIIPEKAASLGLYASVNKAVIDKVASVLYFPEIL